MTDPDKIQAEAEHRKAAGVRLTERYGDDRERHLHDTHGMTVGPDKLIDRVVHAGRAGPSEAESRVNDADVSDALHLVSPARARLDDLEHSLIALARDRSIGWRHIAEALGLDTPQAAQQRYRRLGDRIGGEGASA